jgi:NADH-quinone oxidoreductase subunit J
MVLHVIFYVFAAVAVGSALAVITARNPVRSVLALVVTFFAMSGVWMILRAEFLSLILLLVYVGAVMTLFLFVVMMLNIDNESKHSGFVRYLPLGVIIILMLTGIVIAAVGPDYFGLVKMPVPVAEAANTSNTQKLGLLLFTEYAYPFEIAGVVLLAAIIAAITLAHRGPVKRRVQNISDQIAATPANRLRLIKMASEPKQGS